MSRRVSLPLILLVLAAAATAGTIVLLGGGEASGGSGDSAARAERARAAALAERDAALIAARHARAVEPKAGVVADESASSASPDAAAPLGADPAPTGPASAGAAAPRGSSSNASQNANTADVTQGFALPPITAPEAVTQIIQAGNQIARTPYLWGGGHGRWLDHGYDCSGSVSYALAAAGLLNAPLASGPLMSWGKAGRGRWVTIFANTGHVFLVVAGVRFDTSGRDSRSGSRWQTDSRSYAGFVARHPPGL